MKHMFDGLSVTPIDGTRRHVAGWTVVDIVIHDPRSTITGATVNADRVHLDRDANRPLTAERVAAITRSIRHIASHVRALRATIKGG